MTTDAPLTVPLVQPLDTPDVPWEQRHLHVDDFLNEQWQASRHGLGYVHFFLSHVRKPASERLLHAPFMKQFKLFVDYEGKTWRVTGASRLGDIWLTSDFDREHGYDRRVDLVLEQFENWRSEADFELSWAQRWMMGVGFYGVPGDHERPPPKASRHVKLLDQAGTPKTLMGLTQDARLYLLHNLPKPGVY